MLVARGFNGIDFAENHQMRRHFFGMHGAAAKNGDSACEQRQTILALKPCPDTETRFT